MPPLFIGAAMTTLAALVAVASVVIVKWGSDAFSASFLITLRWGLGLITGVLLLMVRRSLKPFPREALILNFFHAMSYLGCIYCVYVAIRFVPLVNALLLFYTGPIFAPILNRMLRKDKEPLVVWIGIVIGFLGVYAILHPGSESFKLTSLWGLLSGFLMSLTMLLQSQLIRTVNKEVISFYAFFFGTMVCVTGFLLAGGDWHARDWQHHLFPPQYWDREWLEWTGIIVASAALGPLSMLVPLLQSGAYRHGSVGQIAPFRYTGLIFAGIIDYIVWDQVPSARTYAGIVLIILGTMLTLMHSMHAQNQQHERA
jgi:drug/metabolite transporter (DMT)-like permease